MKESNTFLAYSSEPFEAPSAHFGVSVDNYVSSLPLVGMEAVDIAQRGLGIGVNPHTYIAAKHLFKDVYRLSDPRNGVPYTGEAVRKYIIPDEVCEFAEARNIPPLVVTSVGSQLLHLVAHMNVPVETKLPVRGYKHSYHSGKLDSYLKFSISPLNTVIPVRIKPSVADKLLHR